MTATPKIYRYLMITSVLLAILAVIVDLVFPSLVPPTLRAAEATILDASVEPGTLTVASTLVVAAIVGFVGLFRFRAWARPLNLILCASAFIFEPLIGYALISGWGLALSQTSIFIWGIVTALTYVPPLEEKFRS